MTVEDSFACFRSLGLSRALGVTERTDPEIFGSRVSTVQRGDAALRLVWDGKEEMLVLEITHGPPGSPTTWLDLFKARDSRGQLRGDQEDVTFESAVEYGLDLLGTDPALSQG